MRGLKMERVIGIEPTTLYLASIEREKTGDDAKPPFPLSSSCDSSVFYE